MEKAHLTLKESSYCRAEIVRRQEELELEQMREEIIINQKNRVQKFQKYIAFKPQINKFVINEVEYVQASSNL
jgi:hypothetical protein